jgi:hypothetical protein
MLFGAPNMTVATLAGGIVRSLSAATHDERLGG